VEIIRLDVASILTVVIKNMGIPIASANTDLSDVSHQTFRSVFDLALSDYIIESNIPFRLCTAATSCDCSQTVHLSGMYSLGVENPSVPDVFDISFPVT
jgi:hypothetical protein